MIIVIYFLVYHLLMQVEVFGPCLHEGPREKGLYTKPCYSFCRQNYTGLAEAVCFFLEVHSVKDVVPVVMGDLDEHTIKTRAENPQDSTAASILCPSVQLYTSLQIIFSYKTGQGQGLT